MADKISIEIALEGSEASRKQLVQLGQAGEQAFKQIHDAASEPIVDQAQIDQAKQAIADLASELEKTDTALTATGDAGQHMADELGNVAEQANKAKEAVSNFTLENVKSGSEIVKNTAHAALYGAEIYGLLVKHESLTVMIAKMALGGGVASVSLDLLVGVLGRAVVGIGATTLAIGGVVIALGELAKAAQAAAAPYEKLNNTLQTLSENSGVSFDSLQRGEALFGQIGVSADTFRASIAKVAEEIKNLDVAKELQGSADAVKNAATDIKQAELALQEARLRQQAVSVGGERGKQLLAELAQLQQQRSAIEGIKTAEEKLAAARDKAAEATANNLQTVLGQVSAISLGFEDITFDPLVKGETILKALALSMKEAENNGQASSKALLDFIANADRLNALAAGKKFGLSEEDVDRIRRAKGELGSFDEIWQRIQSAGVLIPPEVAASLEEMRVKMEAVQNAKTRLQQAWDSSFFAKFGADVSSTLDSLKADFINFAAQALESLNKFFNALPAAVDLSIAQVKQIWFEGWAAMAQTIADFAQRVGLASLSAQLQEFARSWQQAAAGAAQDSEAAAQRVRQAWDQSGGAAEAAVDRLSGKIQETATAAQQAGNVSVGANNAIANSAEVAAKHVDTLAEKYAKAAQAARDAAIAARAMANEATRDPMTGQLGISAYDPANLVFASGGFVGGTGTGTSDSNLAWVSRGEHIMPARAVAQPGVLVLLEALRRSGGNLSRVLDGMGRFALGGLVPRAIPAFASGGLAGGMSNVTIQFPGLPAISGLRASSDVVDELHKAAALAQVRSGGRKPSRYS